MRRIPAGLVLVLCALAPLAPTTASAAPGPDFGRYVAIGDGFTAGYQDGSLHAAAQAASYVALVAEAAGTTVELPLVEEPGFPTPNSVTGLGLLVRRPGTCAYGLVDLATGRSRGRIAPLVKATNVAVPFQTVDDVVMARWRIDDGGAAFDTFEDLVLGFPYALTGERGPSAQLETAIALEPTFVSIWVGPSDALLAALSGGEAAGLPTPIATFEERVDEIAAAVAATGAGAVVLGVPEVTSTPLLLSFKEIKARTGWSTKQVKKRLGITKSSYVTIASLPTIDAIDQGQANGPLATSQVITADELANLRAHVARYNRKLAAVARDHSWAFADLNRAFLRYEVEGIEVAGSGRLTTKYLGGLYGLDAMHPSNTGQAVIALSVIAAINVAYGTALPLPNVPAVAVEDPSICRE